MSAILAAVSAGTLPADTPPGYPTDDVAAALRWLADEALRLYTLVTQDTRGPVPTVAVGPFMAATDIRRLCAERGWSSGRLILALRRAAQERGVHLPDNASLKRNVTRWRTGQTTTLTPFYAELLSDVFAVRFTHRDLPADLAVAR
ncbi:hypothetical protein AB1484_36200 [Parafrankia sp. FMc6]|uniref:hypothetical protein n=1 Tax=Parafrankia soli TaxID=2599596 RepID=UPI0034D608F6